jgi:putative membrane protein
MEQEHGQNMRIVNEPDPVAHARRRRATNDDFRTHMANERTFLAWCRTSIALLVFGFVVERLDIMVHMPGAANSPVGNGQDLYLVSMFSFILSGVLILVSGWRFLVVRGMIRRGAISLSIFPEVMVILSMFLIIAMVIALMLR